MTPLWVFILTLVTTITNGDPITKKETLQDCPFQSGPFLLVRGAAFLNQAEGICRDRNRTLARITDANAADAIQVADRCQVPLAWMASYNGLNGMPCMFLSPFYGGPVMQVDWSSCEKNLLSVLCQDLDVVTDTATLTMSETVTITSGTSTDLVRTTRKPECRERACDKEFVYDTCNPTCNGACRIPGTPFGFLNVTVPASLAAAECAKHNLTIANVTSGELEMIERGAVECGYPDNVVLWLRSFNGVSAPAFVAHIPFSKEVYFGVRLSFLLTSAYPLCQRNQPLQTGYGPARIAITGTTTTTPVSTVVTTIPEATITVTNTIIRQRKPCHRPHAPCKEEK